ncbi:MAG: PAS domain S-box protein, partial [Alphaproteobacteria bacterium]|nr:PAS domain S-box protein [Alphaproteobacteria bacterium]
GYLARIGGQTVSMTLDAAPGAAPIPTAIPALADGMAANRPARPEAPMAEFVALADGRALIRSFAPIRRILPDGDARVVGYVSVGHILDERHLDFLSRRTGLTVSQQIEGQAILGGGHAIPTPWSAIPALRNDVQPPSFRPHKDDHGHGGAVRLMLADGKSLLFTLHAPETGLSDALASFRSSTLGVLLLAGILVITLGTLFLNRVLFAPLDGLADAAEDLSAGRPMRLDLNATPIEVAALARTLARMAQTIREREESLRRLNAELEQRVQERSAALLHSQERYRDYVETASDWVWEMGPDLRFTHFSDRIRDIVGIEPAALVGKRRDDVAAPEDPEAWRRHLDDLAQRRPFRDFRYPLRRPDGSRVFISISGKPIFAANGEFQGYRGVGTNVTVIVEAERETAEARRSAEIASRTKSEFLANVSHELRTPLNAILGYSDIMRNQIFGPVGNDRYQQYTGHIHESGQHLLQLINDILDVSAIEAGKLELHESPCRVTDAIEAAIRMVRPRVEEKKLALKVAVPKGLPLLLADERRLKQILINLLSNAAKFTKAPGEIRLVCDITAGGEIR